MPWRDRQQAPQTDRFRLTFGDVPPEFLYPNGKYPYWQRAPEKHGGRIWNIRGHPRPWELVGLGQEPPPAEFSAIFGDQPRRGDYPLDHKGRVKFSVHLQQWNDDLARFKRGGMPDGIDRDKLETAQRIFDQYNMGDPVFWEARYGWRAHFPDSIDPAYHTSLTAVLNHPDDVVGSFQISALRKGLVPEPRHWYVPAQLWPGWEPEEPVEG